MKLHKRILSLCLIGALSGLEAASASAHKPNIIMIYADDLGYGDLSVNGHPVIQTPHLDQMAAEGRSFKNFTVNNPVCSPSRVGLFTGQFPSRLSVHEHFSSPAKNRERGMPDFLDPDVANMASTLKAAGYATAHYGKWHLGTGDNKIGVPQYMDYGYDDAAVYAWPGPDTRHVMDATPYEDKKGNGGAHHGEAPSYLTVAAVENAINFIDAHQDKPFFINLWIHETHTTVTAREEDRLPYLNVPEPEQTYYSAVTRADTQIGRLFAKLDELDLADDTLIVFSSDNGPEGSNPNTEVITYFSRGSAAPFRGLKRSLYNGGVGVPFIVRWPNQVPAGTVDTETIISAVDMLPTFAAAAGADLDESLIDGENMLPALKGQMIPREKALFWLWQGNRVNESWWPAFAMRDNNLTYLLSQDGQRAELYDILEDREQSNNLIKSYPEVANRMRRQIEAWVETLPETVPARLTTDAKERNARVSYRPAATVGATPAPASKSEKSAPAKDPLRANIFERLDKNDNSRLEWKEYKLSGPFPRERAKTRARYESFDSDGDGSLSFEEFTR